MLKMNEGKYRVTRFARDNKTLQSYKYLNWTKGQFQLSRFSVTTFILSQAK